MVCRISRSVVGLASLLLGAGAARAQDIPDPQAMQTQVQRIVQERPREAEAVARAYLMLVDGVPQPGLSARSLDDQYWAEVAQLTVQFGMVQNLNRRDSVRAQLVGKMFGLEANARAQQRAYRGASESNHAAIRKQIEALITQHFDLEDKLRGLEIADIERRLADVRAETQRRRDKRAEFIKFAVDDIIRDAIRPR